MLVQCLQLVGLWIETYRSDITKLILLASNDLPQNAAHDLARASLGKITDDVDGLGGSEGTDAAADLEDELLAESVVDLGALLDGNEGVDGLAGELVGNTDDSSLGDRVVLNQSSLNLGSAETVATNVDNVVDTAADPVEALVVAGSTVAREVVALVDVEVGIHVALVGTPDGASHAGPSLLEGQDTLDVVAVNLLAGNRVDKRGLDTEEGERGRAGLGGGNASKGSDDVGTGLGLPVGVANLGAALADNIVVPLPDLGGDGLTNGAENTEVLHLVADVVVTGTLQQAESSGGNVELSDLVLLDDVPVAGEVGIGGGTLENDGRDTEKEGGVDDIGVTGNPADVTTAEVPVTVVDVENVLAGHGSTEKVTSGRVGNTLGLASGAGSVEKEERILRGHGYGGVVGRVLLNLLVPPEITTGSHVDVGAGALEDENVANIGALLESLIDDLLGADQLATALALIGGDDDLGLGIDDTVAEGVGGETGENDGVDGADSAAGKQGNDGLGNHGEVDGDGVTLLDAQVGEDMGELGDLPEELAIGDIPSLTGLVGLVDDGDSVGVLVGVSVDAVVRGVELALYEPGVVAVGEGTAVGGLEILAPRKELAGALSPEHIGLGDGLLVQLLVLLEVWRKVMLAQVQKELGQWLGSGIR